MPFEPTQEPSDEVLKLPFGPLLDHMMRHAIGLPNHLGGARWKTGQLIGAIGLGIAEVTVTSWKSGLGFPDGGTWTRLRQALTDKIEPGPQEMWQACLDVAWKAASKLNAEGRKALYAPFRAKKGGEPPPELDEAPAQEAAALKADIAGLHNRDPDLFSGLHAAFRAQEAGDYPKAEAILFPIVAGGRSKAEEAK